MSFWETLSLRTSGHCSLEVGRASPHLLAPQPDVICQESFWYRLCSTPESIFWQMTLYTCRIPAGFRPKIGLMVRWNRFHWVRLAWILNIKLQTGHAANTKEQPQLAFFLLLSGIIPGEPWGLLPHLEWPRIHHPSGDTSESGRGTISYYSGTTDENRAAADKPEVSFSTRLSPNSAPSPSSFILMTWSSDLYSNKVPLE